jgi:hypothetical protein
VMPGQPGRSYLTGFGAIRLGDFQSVRNHPARDAGVFRRRWYCGPAGGLSSARAGVHGGVDWGCH